MLLFEQVDRERFPGLGDLPKDCGVVRFPSLDTNLLWPVEQRVLAQCVAQGWDEDVVVDYYLTRYGDFRVDLARLATLETARLRARDEKADVTMFDAIGDVVSRPLFLSKNHPRPETMRVLIDRVVTAAAAHVPEIAGFVPPDRVFDRDELCVPVWSVPIHPGVAAELGLTWYDPDYRALQMEEVPPPYDGLDITDVRFVRRTHEEHVRNVVRSAIASRDASSVRGAPIDGPIRIAGPAAGLYPDGFAMPQLRADLEALSEVEAVALDLYYPPQHLGAATLVCTLGEETVEAVVEPGQPVTLTLPARLERGARARLALSCSQTLNMLARGLGEDDRDLGVLLLKLRAR